MIGLDIIVDKLHKLTFFRKMKIHSSYNDNEITL